MRPNSDTKIIIKYIKSDQSIGLSKNKNRIQFFNIKKICVQEIVIGCLCVACMTAEFTHLSPGNDQNILRSPKWFIKKKNNGQRRRNEMSYLRSTASIGENGRSFMKYWNYMQLHALVSQSIFQRCKYEENPNQCKLFTNFRSFFDSLGGKKKQFAKQNAKEKSLTKLQTSNFDFRSVDLNVVKMYK